MKAITKKPVRKEPTEAEWRATITASQEYWRTATKIVAARYDRARDTIVIDLSTGVTLAVPRSAIAGFRKAKSPDFADLEIGPEGQTLWSDAIDDGVEFEQLPMIVFGQDIIGFLGARINASKKSPARAKASRANGRKGGRPRKKVA